MTPLAYFMLNISETVQDRPTDIVTMEYYSHALLKGVISDDLE